MSFLRKIQGLPITTRKIILWLVVIVIAVGLSVLFAKNASQRFKDFNSESFLKELNLPDFSQETEKLQKIKKIKMPEMKNYGE